MALDVLRLLVDFYGWSPGNGTRRFDGMESHHKIHVLAAPSALFVIFFFLFPSHHIANIRLSRFKDRSVL